MDNELMYILNNNKQKYPVFKLKLFVEKLRHGQFELTNQDLRKVPKFFMSTIERMWL